MKLAPIRHKFIVFAGIVISLITMASPAMALIWKAAEVIAPTNNNDNRETPALAVQKNGQAHIAYEQFPGK